jgi:hypothetical protein
LPRTSRASESHFGFTAKAGLAVRVWRSFVLVRIRAGRKPLPLFAHELGRTTVRTHRYAPSLLSRAVHRSLHLGPYRPRCLFNALVLYRLLREQGDDAELVIGLPPEAPDQTAHAWVELDGRDVGPPPGKVGHTAIARFS